MKTYCIYADGHPVEQFAAADAASAVLKAQELRRGRPRQAGSHFSLIGPDLGLSWSRITARR